VEIGVGGEGGFCSIEDLIVGCSWRFSAMECVMFKSPTAKLIRFFRKSRNGWKAKCQEAKRKNKKLTNQTRAVEKSREHWKQLAQLAQQQVRELRQELEELKNTAAAPG
jgi:hypothetical protein